MPIFSTLRWSGIVTGLLWAGLSAAVYGAEETADKNVHLGFKFDPKVHDAAVAAASRGAPNDNQEPVSSANEVLHLEKIVVTGKVPLNSRDVLTPKGRLDFAKKTYLTPAYEKTFGPLGTLASYYFDFLAVFGGWHPNDADAMALYNDADQKRRNTEMKDLEDLAALADPTVTKLPKLKPLDRSKAGWHLVVPTSATP